MKRLLMIAFHYPPAAGSSGVQRALRFSSHLSAFDWQPIVLTANARAYEQRSNDLIAEVPEGATIIRAQAWDTKRHFSIRGRYPTFLALPDRWASWYFWGVGAGMTAIRRHRPDAIWSTYPIATAHRIGAELSMRSGLPFIADFRDPMAQDGYPSDPRVWRSFARVERKSIATAAISTFTTPGAVELYKRRYPASASRIHLLENGYDDAVFGKLPSNNVALNEKQLTLLHSGIVYPSERDPNSLFAAMRSMRLNDPAHFSRLVVRFRAPVHVRFLQELANQYGIEEAVQILPPISYADAILEMIRADGQLILQAGSCNAQIPAKFYEYLRAGPPILVITDPNGDTADAARRAGLEAIATFNEPKSIYSLLDAFLSGRTDSMQPQPDAVRQASRRTRTKDFVRLLDSVVKPTELRNPV